MRRWFQRRHPREQLLLTAFVALGALIWLIAAAGRMRTRWREWHSAQSSLSDQQRWLARRADIEARAAAAVRNLDPAKTYDATRLVSTVNSLAQHAGLTPAIDSPHSERTPQFAYHTVKVTFRRAALPALLSFYDQLAQQAPYLSLEQIALQTERSAAGQLNATLQISATQIAK